MAVSERLLWMCSVMLVLLTQHTSHSEVAGFSVDPPENIRITDQGYLGHLSIEWNKPRNLQNLTDCAIRYQLRFYDTYMKRWRSVRTIRLSYDAQFDLEKPIQVRMLTLVKGACTNGTEVQGQEVELVHSPETTGVPGSRIRDFHCVYFNKEYMDCTWKSGSVDPPHSTHYLYYWHREMQGTAECPEYIPSSTFQRGCRFPQKSLLEFSEFNVCVNGSSAAGALKPAFFSFQVQNKVKPVAVSELVVLAENGLIEAQWMPPGGPVPEQCLEYELEGTTEGLDGSKWQWTNMTEETNFSFLWNDESERTCFRVRSKVNGYCADEGFWSDWSQPECFPVFTEAKVEKSNSESWNLFALAGIAVIVIAIVLILCFTLRKLWVNQKEQKGAFCRLYQEKVHKAIPPILNPMFH